jgi:catechol 2,3-dioxygenase-like lactoylglutathione lyase family enzyme
VRLAGPGEPSLALRADPGGHRSIVPRPPYAGAVPVQLNHTIVWCTDRERSATFATEILGLPPAVRFGPFMVVELANGVSIDFHPTDEPITSQHYAFLITEEEFDQVHGRITERGLDYWADPGCRRHNEINRADGGRGIYFNDPDGHLLEVITRPYGSG